MPEPTTIGLGIIGAYLAKDGVSKLLGPSCEIAGQRLGYLTESGFKAVEKICKNARGKLGNKIEEAGTVPPRVLKEVIDEGSCCTEQIDIEYMGGILASSRTPQGRDDRGARVAKLVSRLSSYQKRTHYLIYGSIKHVFAARDARFATVGDRGRMRIFMPMTSYVSAMDFTQAEIDGNMLNHIFHGLADENIIEGSWAFGNVELMKQQFGGASEGGIVCTPSAVGVELFLFAFGHGQKPSEFVFDKSFSARVDGLPPYVEGAKATLPATTS